MISTSVCLEIVAEATTSVEWSRPFIPVQRLRQRGRLVEQLERMDYIAGSAARNMSMAVWCDTMYLLHPPSEPAPTPGRLGITIALESALGWNSTGETPLRQRESKHEKCTNELWFVSYWNLTLLKERAQPESGQRYAYACVLAYFL